MGRTGDCDGVDGKALGDLGQQLLRRAAVEVAHDAVVVEDGHLVMGEDHAQEIAVRPLRSAARLRDAGGCRGAVMAVGDVERGQRLELRREVVDQGSLADHPQLVGDGVVRRDRHVGIALGGALERPVDLGRVRIGHHHGTRLGVERLDLPDAVGLLHGRRQLVLLDAPRRVGVERGDAGKARLPAARPGGAIGIVVGVGVAHQHALAAHALEVLGRGGVDRRRIGVGADGQIDLGLGDVQEAPGLALGALARLRAREHVVGRGDDLAGVGRHGAKRTERPDERHVHLSRSWLCCSFSGSAGRLQLPHLAGRQRSNAREFDACGHSSVVCEFGRA